MPSSQAYLVKVPFALLRKQKHRPHAKKNTKWSTQTVFYTLMELTSSTTRRKKKKRPSQAEHRPDWLRLVVVSSGEKHHGRFCPLNGATGMYRKDESIACRITIRGITLLFHREDEEHFVGPNMNFTTIITFASRQCAACASALITHNHIHKKDTLERKPTKKSTSFATLYKEVQILRILIVIFLRRPAPV